MFAMKSWLRTAVPIVAILIFTGCSGSGGESGSTGGSGAAAGFESDDPGGRDKTGGVAIGGSSTGSGGSAGSGAPPGAGGGAPINPNGRTTGDSASRAIVEADILKVEGNTLYALAEYGGLSIIDISNHDDLRMQGRFGIRGRPFEMYVRSGVAYAMFSSFARYVYEPTTGGSRYVVSSRIVAIDVTEPTSLREIGTFDLPGEISDSRMVGDVIYLVSYENGSCWGCQTNQPRTTVTSIAAGDPSNIRKVDQRTFDDPRSSSSWYRRSIHVTTDRIYVSGMVYDGQWGADTGHSTIQAVDISDPTGQLGIGANVRVSGQIESRWQMDELDGVLRVVSQSGSTWANGPPPVVETFTVKDALTITPLGKLTLTLPKRENLKSVRFDGKRGYAVTFEQIDPLFTLDLADPALPKQVGEVEMPGFLHHMEPRGDRLVALGIDNRNLAGGLTVSIFDVADLARPTLLSRANFGSQWGSLPEDQDRIHKVFRLFDDKNLIAMPFSGYMSSSGGPFSGCGAYVSGVQLLDFTRDEVTTRGIVPLRGSARRAFMHGETLFAVSDDQVASFNIDDRDVPARRDALALANVANLTVRVGEHLVALGSDWWTNEPQLTVVPISAGAQGVPVATIDLAKAVNPTSDPCYSRYWSGFAGNSQLFVEGTNVYIAYDAGFAGAKGRMGFAVLDMSDPLQPVLRGSAILDIIQNPPPQSYAYRYYGCGVGSYVNPTGVWASGDRIVKVGTTLVLLELEPVNVADAGYAPYDVRPAQAILHAVDLADPTQIRVASSTKIADGGSSSGLFADGSRVFTSHQEEVVARPGRTRFFIDQLDFTDPSAPAKAKINVPGSLLTVDRGGERVVTVDYRRTLSPRPPVESQITPCDVDGGFAIAGWIYGNAPYGQREACLRVYRTLKLVDLAGGGATLLDSLEPAGEIVTNVATGSDRIWIERSKYVQTGSSWGHQELNVETLTGLRAGRFRSESQFTTIGSQIIPERSGTRFAVNALSQVPSRILVVDTSDATQPRTIVDFGVNGSTDSISTGYYGVAGGITVDPRYLIWSMGKYGAAAIPLP
jgi:hypothetical protein